MANRDPKQCAKAVQGFWNNERELIKQGQGTRDWSVQEQIEVMNFKPSGGERKNAAAPTYGQGELGEYGMNYDKYEGQHMKSAEAHPDFQGDPNNIQALTRGEHQQAHSGDFRNPTNGYYNPETGQISDFGDNPPNDLQPLQLNESYVDTSEYQYIRVSTDTQQEQRAVNDQEQAQTAPEQARDTTNESANMDALAAYEQRQADMQNPTQDNFDNVLGDFELKKAEMQDVDYQKDNIQNILETKDDTVEQTVDNTMGEADTESKSESGGIDM